MEECVQVIVRRLDMEGIWQCVILMGKRCLEMLEMMPTE